VINHGGPAVALIGPTASGKSSLAHELALERRELEILALDAMTVYRGMDIATAKATPAQRAQVAYHLVDLVEPSEEFSLAQYQRAAREAAHEVWDNAGAVLYVGGTGLHGRAVLDNLEIPGQFREVRSDLEARVAHEREELFALLVSLDPVAASRMEPTNERRLVRALEVTLGSGRPFSSYGPGLRHYAAVRVVQVGLRVEADELDRRIEERFHAWMDQGLLDEVRTLAATPGGLSRTARQAVGYRELLAHVEGGEPLERCVEAAITRSRRLARRQRSWFQRDPRIEWFEDPGAARARLIEVVTSPDGFVRD